MLISAPPGDGMDADMTVSCHYQVPDLSGRRAIVTGGAKGIGAATARLLAQAGADVVIAARDARSAQAHGDDINRQLDREAVVFAPLDLANSASVQAFAEDLQGKAVDLLINNAGVMEISFQRTADGFERNLGINFLGHFLLSALLVPNLKKCSEPRVVQLTSGSHRMAPFEFEDPNFDRSPFDKDLAYPRSKTACALFAVGFSRRFARHGIEAFSVAPGVVRTDILSVLGDAATDHMMRALAPLVRTADEAALSVVYAATASALKGRGGAYIEDCAPARAGTGDTPGGVMPHAVDPDTADRLWSFAEAQLQGFGRNKSWETPGH